MSYFLEHVPYEDLETFFVVVVLGVVCLFGVFCFVGGFFFETGKILLGFQVVEENFLGPDHLAICEKEIGAAQRTFDFREGLTPLEPAVKWSNCVA